MLHPSFRMGKLVDKHCSLFSLRKPVILAKVIAASMVFTCLLTYWFSPLLVKIPSVLFSTIFLIASSSPKVVKFIDQNSKQSEDLTIHDQNNLDPLNKYLEEKHQARESDDKKRASKMVRYQLQSLSSLLDAESCDELIESKALELDLMRSSIEDCDGVVSHLSTDDEEEDGLIKISLPSTVCIDNATGPKPRSDQCAFWSKSTLENQGMVNISTDVDEMNEDNYIELDILMGSIK